MIYYKIAKALVIIGGLNWGLIGVSNILGGHLDLVEYLGYGLLNAPLVSSVIYIIVGIATLIVLISMLNRK